MQLFRKIFLFILIVSAGAVNAQLFHYDKFDIGSGLSQIHISSLYEDEFGFLWVGTMGGGLDKFDGKNFTTYNEKDGIPGELVLNITGSSKNEVIVGSTWGGIGIQKNGKFTHIKGPSSFPGMRQAMTWHGTTWLASSSGLYYLSADEIKPTSEKEPQNIAINSLDHDDKRLYALGNSKVYVFEPVSKVLVTTLNFSTPTAGKTIKITGDKILIGTEGSGLYYAPIESLNKKENEATINVIPIENNVASTCNFIYSDGGSTVWAAFNDQKLYNITGTALIENRGFSFLDNANFTSMLIDRGGTIWLGTDAMGLLKIINPIFINYSNNDFLNDPNIFAINKDDNDNIWVGSRTKGLLIYNEKTREQEILDAKNGFSNNVSGIAKHNDKMYLATSEGIFCVNIYTRKKEGFVLLKDVPVKTIAIYDDGTIAAGTNGKGLYVIYPSGKIDQYNESNKFIHNYIHSLLVDASQRLWIGTGNGMAFLQDGKIHVIDQSNFCNSYIGCISQDKFGNIWFSTDRCLMRYDGMKFEKYDRSNGLASNTLYLVKCDNKNNVWVGSNAGLNRLVLGPYGKIEKIDHFNADDGFIGNECNSRGVFQSVSGELYFSTVSGLIKYLGEEEYKTVCNHKILVDGLSVFFSKVAFGAIPHGKIKKGTTLFANPVFSYQQNHLTFHYLCTEKCKPEDVSYSYMLENFDKDWSPAVKTNFATYNNLPPGNYTFKIKTLDKNKDATGIFDSYTFTIRAPFWQKPWFYILAAISFFGLLAYLKFRTEQREEFQRVQLEKKVNQRTIELIKQKEERELLLKEIHHRVKNNLQIINSLINLQAGQIKDKESLKVFEECKNRIKSMAIIHTKFYESKDFSKIDLADYVKELVKDLIHTYNVDKNIELICNINSIQMGIDTVIPVGLILNEIISNSLKYAFREKESGKVEITLRRDLSTDEFEMHIGDDGNGFDKKSFSDVGFESLGFELIKILSEQLNGKIELLNAPGTVYRLRFFEIDKQRSPITT